MPFMHNSTIATMTAPVEREMRRDLAELTAVANGSPTDTKLELAAKVDENGVDYGSSRPPSPPSTGATTPLLRIAPCPLRLWPLVPPPQYGVVEDGTIFRSSYPQDRNMEFIKSLDIKSILTLVETDPTPGYAQWLTDFEIKQGKVTITPNKEAKAGKAASATSIDSICEALLFAMDGRNHPLWIHCNQGRHRTGCVIACLRKIQGTPIEEILDEYIAYASPKVRSGDIALIKSFEPSAVFTYAKRTGFIGGPNPVFKPTGMAPITDVYKLAHELGKAGRLDSFTCAETLEALDRLSATMSEISIDGSVVQQPENASLADSGTTPRPMTSGMSEAIDPRLLGNAEGAHDEVEMGVTVVEVENDPTERAEVLALRGEPDPALDHEGVAEALY